MKKDTNTMISLDVKSNLAKLIATENITIQHNKVSTASFDVKNRVLTLPIFKEQSGDVYDMLIAHECAHALWTPFEQWEEICEDAELKSYVNVLEDTRIDKLIQAKYPGVVRNYMNGFDILENQDFFGLKGKNIQTDLMLIDKVNMRSKSLDRLTFAFTEEDNSWLDKVDSIKTFADTISVAKEMLDWQKAQVEELKKLPNFDDMPIAQNYELSDEEFDEEDMDDYMSANENSDEADEKNDYNNFGGEEASDEKPSDKDADFGDVAESTEDEEEATHYGSGAGGKSTSDKLLKATTADHFAKKHEELLDEKVKGFVYGELPEPNYKDSLTDYKKFLSEFQTHKNSMRRSTDVAKYDTWLKNAFGNFQKENKKTVMYLVKEFEMKKSATAYKRATTDKTGVLDSLKLKDYKFSDDLFKRLTVIPDGKNHGMMLLLDWSGSMSDTLMNTVEQLINLVSFIKKVNIPFEVYFFTSERKYSSDGTGYDKSFNYKKDNNWMFEDFNLVNCASHRMNKQELNQGLMYMYHMAYYYNASFVYHKEWNSDLNMARYDSYGIPRQYNLGNTPLNEALIFCNGLIPLFKKKYGIEKMTFITLTDGGANGFRNKTKGQQGKSSDDSDWESTYDKTAVISINNKKLLLSRYQTSDSLTSGLLRHIGKAYNTNVIGFYILKRVRQMDIEQHIVAKDYFDRQKKTANARKEMTKNKALAVDKNGYKKYFLLDGKKMKVENFDLDKADIKKGTASEFKRAFGKSMANRLVSRVVLNKFIQEVA